MNAVPTGMTAETQRVALTPFQERLVLSVCPAGTRLLDARPGRPGPERCPLRVRVALPGGAEHPLYLRLDRSGHGVDREARLLPTLRRLGLPVPEVLAGPVRDPAQPELAAMAVYAELPGENLLRRSWRTPIGAQRDANDGLADQLLEGIALIQGISGTLAGEEIASLLPQEGLAHELRWHVQDRLASSPDDPWRGDVWLEQAVRLLGPPVERAERETPPRCFWNGDYNPGNFLSDGARLTGIVDVAWASWHDPHYGLARFTVYEWVLFDRPRLFRRYQERHGIGARHFALRSAVHAATTLLSRPHRETDALLRATRAQLERDLAQLA
ncbi:MAG: hypothetical protein AVDCRST_MAG77-5876 [uncultured Chloroflexi bacterium]|uniref:Uncharacterized protein n=1 Tax=uncultured Chloroflexota bacterium TaxID=166587 RepID=A0A6J4KEN7_9CHLR|nr:MAG: hypothetical protein AVDCRST_MAG77-5876 [uncultured Chloroflexota bacterium]